mmetsp:Transcript_56863/g.132969  ORF Transcript_56863/g.132969 Transcript_56863/m.132969 type:complete len:421 (-) Transcript_56863:43-1305(-)
MTMLSRDVDVELVDEELSLVEKAEGLLTAARETAARSEGCAPGSAKPLRAVYHALVRSRWIICLGAIGVLCFLRVVPAQVNGDALQNAPLALLGLSSTNSAVEKDGCLTNEETFEGLCYMKCSVLTGGNAPYRVSATSCCKENNLFCAFFQSMSTNSPALSMGGGKSPVNQQPHAPFVGGICKMDTQEPFAGLCYPKCSMLTEGDFPIRVGGTACCSGSKMDCLSGHGTRSDRPEFGAGVHAPDWQAESLKEGPRRYYNIKAASCNIEEESFLGLCYYKCSLLTNGKNSFRTSPESCCSCGPGPFQGLCCMNPFVVSTADSYNVGLSRKNKPTDPHAPGFSNGCGDSEEEYEEMCYTKCSLMTDGQMPYRVGPSTCCKYEDAATCMTTGSVLSSLYVRGDERASGTPHGPYIHPSHSMEQ